MVIVQTPTSFDEYIRSLSRKARKNYAYVRKHNGDLTYSPVPFVREEVEGFMSLWEKQLIRGEYRQWAFPVSYFERLSDEGNLLVFAADRGPERVALHFIQRRDGFWEAHPPMFEKRFGEPRYLAKFMWFSLIQYACENGLGILELGGGSDIWRDNIKRRDEFPNPRYKWMYVPEYVKENPDEQPDWELIVDGEQRWMRLRS